MSPNTTLPSAGPNCDTCEQPMSFMALIGRLGTTPAQWIYDHSPYGWTIREVQVDRFRKLRLACFLPGLNKSRLQLPAPP